MCHPPMRHLTMAPPPILPLPSSPSYSAIPSLVYTIHPLWLISIESHFSSLLPVFTHPFAYQLLIFNSNCVFPSSPFSCGFAALQSLTASPSNPIYLSVHFFPLKQHLSPSKLIKKQQQLLKQPVNSR